MAVSIESASGVRVVVGGRRLVSFAGCDSLGLARRREVVAAARNVLAECGLGASASRTTTGTWDEHRDLERALATWLGTEDAVVLSSGWVAGQALAAGLADYCDFTLLDAGAHPALADAAKLAGLPVRTFAHFDAAEARRACDTGRPLVLTDGVDVAAGRVAPLRALAALVAQRGGCMIVDDAHGIGVLGERGRGTVDALGAAGPCVHTAGSLSKALGAHGGFVADTRAVCDRIRERYAGYAGGTPIPPSTAAGAVAAVLIAAAGDDLRSNLRANARLLRRRFAEMGLPVPRPDLPWFSVSGRRGLAAASKRLARAGFLVPHLTYFGAPRGGYLKIAVTAAHTRDEIEALAVALRSALDV